MLRLLHFLGDTFRRHDAAARGRPSLPLALGSSGAHAAFYGRRGTWPGIILACGRAPPQERHFVRAAAAAFAQKNKNASGGNRDIIILSPFFFYHQLR